jgi:hypothetical protein
VSRLILEENTQITPAKIIDQDKNDVRLFGGWLIGSDHIAVDTNGKKSDRCDQRLEIQIHFVGYQYKVQWMARLNRCRSTRWLDVRYISGSDPITKLPADDLTVRRRFNLDWAFRSFGLGWG